MIILTSDLITHVKEIDEQHVELFNCINAVSTVVTMDTVQEQAKKTLEFLGSYIVKHFNDEEILQQKCNYPKHKWHHEMHRWYIAEFNKMNEEYNKNGPSVEFIELLNESIINWIIKHISTVDVSLGEYIIKNKNVYQASNNRMISKSGRIH